MFTSEELAGGRFWTKEEILNNIGKGVFTPNFEEEYKSIASPQAQSKRFAKG